jgi:hypothetical protein
MRSRFSPLLPAACLGVGSLFVSLTATPAFAQKNKKPAASAEAGNGSIEKQSAWEQKVMGQDGDKEADRKKIAAAQRMAAEAKKNPPPEPAVHHKDPSKEGVNAKRESSIGLPIESEEAEKSAPKKTVAKKSGTASSGSSNDELGALVAASLANDKKAEAADSSSSSSGSARAGKGKKGRAAKAPAAKADTQPSSLDRMFAGGK